MYIHEKPSFKEPFKTQRYIGVGGRGGGGGSRNFDIVRPSKTS